MRKWKEDEEIGRGMRKWTENEEMERDFLSIKQFPLFALKLLYYYIEICNFLSQKSVYTQYALWLWHMYHSDETRFYPQDESQTIRRLQKEKNKLGFVDEEQ